ncbi:MAG: Trk family potassium uptake protein, partial [Erysipelotrichales bacterium]|nr:Trk family potassium uptake protein [Erysipelotrichales bacterium]
MSELRLRLRDHLNSFRTIFWGFVLLILAGAFLLSLPSATMDHTRVPFLNALFTSTSAACVTGLVVYDTATQWSIFGRTVILVLIQIGGLGVVTFTILTLMLTGKKIGIMQRVTMQDAISAPQIGGIVRFTKFFLIGTAVMEGLGALALYPVFAREFGAVNGIGYAVFHSVSAFCNAGFDILGKGRPFTSLTTYIAHPGVNLTVILLIVIG